MAGPEFEPQQPQQPEQIQTRPEQAEVPQNIEGIGVQQVPSQPQPLTDPNDSTQVIAQPVPPPPEPNGPSITIPVYQSEEQIEQYTHGDPSNAITWQSVGLIRKIHMAIKKGFRVIFGQN